LKESKKERYQSYEAKIINKMLNFTRILVSSLDVDGRFMRCNDYIASETGYSHEELHGHYYWEFIQQEYKEEICDFYQEQFNQKIDFTVKEVPIITKSGDILWIQQEVCTQFNKTGEITGFEIFGTMINERKKAELKLQETVEKYQRLMREIPDGYYRFDLNGRMQEFNNSLVNLIGYDGESLLGVSYHQLAPNEETALKAQETFSEVYRTKKRLRELEWELKKKNGETIFVSTSISPIVDKKTGDVIGFEGILRDITHRIKELREMTHLATRDMLTGLYNRFWFIEFVKKDLARGLRMKSGRSAIIFIDGNEFKEINDNLGHEAGDTLLKEMASALSDSVRETDVISRYGGDEFCIYLSHVENNTEQIIQKMMDSISLVPYRISMGCSTVDFSKEEEGSIDAFYDAILRQADKNLYAVKKAVKKTGTHLTYQGLKLSITASAYKVDEDPVVIYPIKM
jgi:diguanylate cyclase (GGDEF)-like protein/PAS domain S-box-containing protein